MKISIIGAGNMGGAILRGLASKDKYQITIANPTTPKLDALKSEFPGISITNDNKSAAAWGDVIILAVKPWITQSVISEIKPVLNVDRQQLVSIAAGVGTAKITEWLEGKSLPVYYIIPNTAISIGQSMTFIAPYNAEDDQINVIKSVFDELGKTLVIEEKLMGACMTLASCGIAYAMRYVRASVEGAVELGIKPKNAQSIVLQTILGAAELLQTTGNNPEVEIDKVTTPGGLTIRGLNALEAKGFTTAIVEALKASI